METTTTGRDEKKMGGDQSHGNYGQSAGQNKPNQGANAQGGQGNQGNQANQGNQGGQTGSGIAATAAQVGQAVQQGVTNLVDQAGLTAGVEKAKEAATAGVEKARETASTVAHSVSDAASYVGQRAESAASSVGHALESTGNYLKDDGLNNISRDITDLVKRNPIPALLLGIGFGFLLAQASSRRAA